MVKGMAFMKPLLVYYCHICTHHHILRIILFKTSVATMLGVEFCTFMYYHMSECRNIISFQGTCCRSNYCRILALSCSSI